MFTYLPRLCRSLSGFALRSSLLLGVVLVCSALARGQSTQPTLLTQYRWQIVGVVSFMVLETALIGFLLISRARQRRAEAERERFAQLGRRGVTQDISERKAAEEGLRNALIEVQQLKEKLQQENIYLREQVELEHEFQEIIGNSDDIKYVLFKIQQVAPTDASVLIQGKTGTGKELVAQAIHSAGTRKIDVRIIAATNRNLKTEVQNGLFRELQLADKLDGDTVIPVNGNGLSACDWRIEGVNGAADTLGINSSTLRSRMNKLGIKRPRPNASAATSATQ